MTYPGNRTYQSSLLSYFSAQEEQISPECILLPRTAKDVATAIKILTSTFTGNQSQSYFAIRGGGHTSNAGSANIEGGVTIDLRALNSIVVNAKETITSIGAGATWGDVYEKLDEKTITVSGGRVSQVGVGGLTLGGQNSLISKRMIPFPWTHADVGVGGISYFSPRFGFVCDNVVNYEVVLANGHIVNANERERSDLWIALKGGSNNFGVVTRFDLRTFQQGDFWGGVVEYPISTAPEQIKAFSDFSSAVDYDIYGSLITSFAYTVQQGYGIVNSIKYTNSVVNPATFQPFTAIKPQYASTMRISNLSDFAREQGAFSPNGFRFVKSLFQHQFAF